MTHLELRLDGRTIAKVEIDTELLRRLAFGAVSTPNASGPQRSATLNVEQAREVVARVDKTMREFIGRFVEERGAITWGEAKQTFGVKTWDEFAEGPLKKLEKILHRATGDHAAALFWRDDLEWLGREKDEDEVCRLHIDGPALSAVQTALDKA